MATTLTLNLNGSFGALPISVSQSESFTEDSFVYSTGEAGNIAAQIDFVDVTGPGGTVILVNKSAVETIIVSFDGGGNYNIGIGPGRFIIVSINALTDFYVRCISATATYDIYIVGGET
jgi:hypothetical protein